MVIYLDISEESWKATQDAEINSWIGRRVTLNALDKDATNRLLYFFSVPFPYDRKTKKFDFGDKTVVEVGCGLGNFLRIIKAKELIGVDPLWDKYKEIYKIELSGIKWINANGEEVPLPDNCGDVVFNSNVLNHVHQPEQTIAELQRILKPDGTLYFDCHFDYHTTLHPYIFTRDELKKLLEKYFMVERVIDQDYKWGAVCSCKEAESTL